MTAISSPAAGLAIPRPERASKATTADRKQSPVSAYMARYQYKGHHRGEVQPLFRSKNSATPSRLGALVTGIRSKLTGSKPSRGSNEAAPAAIPTAVGPAPAPAPAPGNPVPAGPPSKSEQKQAAKQQARAEKQARKEAKQARKAERQQRREGKKSWPSAIGWAAALIVGAAATDAIVHTVRTAGENPIANEEQEQEQENGQEQTPPPPAPTPEQEGPGAVPAPAYSPVVSALYQEHPGLGSEAEAQEWFNTYQRDPQAFIALVQSENSDGMVLQSGAENTPVLRNLIQAAGTRCAVNEFDSQTPNLNNIAVCASTAEWARFTANPFEDPALQVMRDTEVAAYGGQLPAQQTMDAMRSIADAFTIA